MKRRSVRLVSALTVLVSAGAGVTAWLLARDAGVRLPEVSAYSHGHTVRVGPYLYCNVVTLDDCAEGGAQGVLAVTGHGPVQVSVPAAIGRAPWRLLKVYADERDATEAVFRPGTRLAVTVPTVDPQRGRLTGIVVQLMTLVRNQNGELFDVPHAEWSVRLVWDRGS